MAIFINFLNRDTTHNNQTTVTCSQILVATQVSDTNSCSPQANHPCLSFPQHGVTRGNTYSALTEPGGGFNGDVHRPGVVIKWIPAGQRKPGVCPLGAQGANPTGPISPPIRGLTPSPIMRKSAQPHPRILSSRGLPPGAPSQYRSGPNQTTAV